MIRIWKRREAPRADEARDGEIGSALEVLDPAWTDPSYWIRFQARVMQGAAPELARRRLMADLTVGDVLSAWARTVVPTAVLAAAVAALVLMRQVPPPAPVTVEELLTAGIETRTIPEVLAEGEAATALVFASDRF